MEELLFEQNEIKEFLGEELSELLETDLVEDFQIKEKRKRKKTTRNYINNEDFCDAVIKHNEKCKQAELDGLPKPKLPDYIGICFIKLAEGLARRPNFFGYSFKEEMVADGIENCLQYVHNFNPEKTKNAFAYFTQILWWCFVRRIKKEKLQQYIKYKATENFGILDEDELMELGDGQIKQIEIYDNLYEFIRDFEEKELKKPVKVVVPKIQGIEKFI